MNMSRFSLFFAAAVLAGDLAAAPLFRQPLPLDDVLASTTNVVSADFNGDGFPDLVNGNLQLWLNNGVDPFAPPVSIAAVSYPLSIAVGDLNTDGKQDLVALHGSGIRAFLGNGNGTFAEAAGGSTTGTFGHLALGDVTGDGKLDVVLATAFDYPGRTSSDIAWFAGNGSGGFGSIHTTTLSTNPVPSSMTVADVNADGRADVLIAQGSTAVYLSTGSSLTWKASYAGAAPVTSRLNADSIPDLVTRDLNQPVLSFYLGNGDGTFTANGSQAVYGTQTLIADFDHDSVHDVLSSGSLLAFSRGLGNGSFAEPLLASAPLGPIVSGDFDRDTHRDVLSSTSLLRGNGDGTFAGDRIHATRVIAGGRSDPGSALDVNGDGKADFTTLLSTETGTTDIVVRRGDGSGGFLPPQFTPTTNLGNPWSFFVMTIDGDAYPDAVVVADIAGARSATSFLGNGDGTFRSGSTTPISPYGIAQLTDVTGDGTPDLLAGSELYEGNGDGSFDVGRTTSATFTVVGDVNDDGKQDAVWIAGNQLRVALNTGGGVFADALVVGSGATPRALADLDGDGAVDILANSDDYAVVFRGHGDGTFFPPVATQLVNLFYIWDGVGPIDDFDGDGKLDVAAPGRVLLGNGDGRFRAIEEAPFFVHYDAADFNGDGHLDLAGAFGGVFVVHLLRLAPAPVRSSAIELTVPGSLKYATPALLESKTTGTRQPVTGSVLYSASGTPLAIVSAFRDQPVGTQSIARTSAMIALPAGTYPLTATFLGNSTHLPSSTTTSIHVDRATTSLTIVPSSGATYGQPLTIEWTLGAKRVAGMPGPTGGYSLTEGGSPLSGVTWSASSATIVGLNAGMHTLTLQFAGDSNYAPVSKMVTFEVGKQYVTVSNLQITPAAESRLAGPVTFSIAMLKQTGGPATGVTGSIEFLINANSVGTVPLTADGTAALTVTVPAGDHLLEVRYSGDANHWSQPIATRFPVFYPAGSPTQVTATASPSGAVVRWLPVAGVQSYRLYQRLSLSGPWYYVGTITGIYGANVSLPYGAARMFTVEPVDANGNAGAMAAPDLATRITFTDNPVVPGTPIRAAHVTELRTAVNAVRTFAGLSAFPFTDTTLTNLSPRALHFTEVREALTQARNAIGMPMAFGTAPAPDTLIRATHIEELRAGVR